MKLLLSTLVSIFLACPVIAGIKVGTLHPLLDDLAKNVGGEHVQVIPLMPPGGDPHAFRPTPSTMAQAVQCQLILASGKGLETYLGKLADNLPPNTRIIETGKKVPSLTVEEGALFVCCPHHSQGSLDPHWWHSPEAVGRAARYLAKDFAEADPANAKAYKANAKAFKQRMVALSDWIKTQLAPIPKKARILATAHAAFGYFCRDFKFRALPVQGLGRERDPSPSYFAETTTALREQDVRAVFPEKLANPKILSALAREAGVKVGGTLEADASSVGITYEKMMRGNVAAITAALIPKS